MNHPIILILRPLKKWGIIVAELRFVESLGRYMDIERKVRKELLNDDVSEQLLQLVSLCEELQAGFLYMCYANRKMFCREADFWDSEDKMLQNYVKDMADKRLLKVINIATELDIPILYAKSDKSALHVDDRLWLHKETTVTPVMNFQRHDEGTNYQLYLRLGERVEKHPDEHSLTVLTYQPGMFILDHNIYLLREGFSSKLLIPFMQKPMVSIPRRIENDYFRRFILKNVAKVEIHANGFDIDNISEKVSPCLTMEMSVNGQYLLSLRFKYGNVDYPSDGKPVGRVSLREKEDGGFQFIRQLRDTQREQQAWEQVAQTGARMTAEGIIRFPTISLLLDWLRQYGPQLRSLGIDVVQPSDHVYYIGPLNVRQSDVWHGDWLQTDVTIELDNGRLLIPFHKLRDTILRGEQEYMLPTGERLLIPNEWLQRYGDLLLTGIPKDNGFRRHRSQVMQIKESPEHQPTQTSKQHSDKSLPTQLQATLRPYQVVGFEWLWGYLEARMGCCLSDEMGLGKTLQTIALLLKYKETARTNVRKPVPGLLFTEEEMSGNATTIDYNSNTSMKYHTSLVIAPASVVHNWYNELHRFAPSLQVCSYINDVEGRRKMRQSLTHYDVVLTTYRTLVNDIAYLADMQWGIAVFDESQAFKTASSQVHQAVVQVQSLARVALSGTPVENNLGELWSLMNVLNPCLLGDAHSFQKNFIQPIAKQMEEKRTALLRKLIAPFFLKRTKEEVLHDLPKRQDEIVVCTMSDEQASLYAEELSRARNEWMDTSIKAAHKQIHILAAIQKLRQIANGEGKMNVVFNRLEELHNTQHKVLIFSEYVTLLEKVASLMDERGWQYDMLTGKTTQREQVIAHFQETEECQFFLISLKAGGVGLNLTAADYVFLLDPWWNQAAEEQAIARSHRIGQHRPVFVYRFVAKDTLEEQIITLQEHKQNLIDSVMPFILKNEN